MSYKGERVIQVSMENIKAWIETGLRNFKEIPNSQYVEIEFEHTGLKVEDWSKLTTVPLRLKLKETEEVEVHRVNGKDG